MGNRFVGGIEPGAMPPLHRCLGNPVLSFVGRLFYGSSIGDFHCGLRGFDREAILGLNLRTTGMEYASEMVVQAQLNDLRITEVPTTLSKDGRSRPPHLRSWRDGWRHLKFLLMHSPNWLFFYPGIAFLLVGIAGLLALSLRDVRVGPVQLGVHSLMFCGAFANLGLTAISYGYLTRVFAKRTGYIPATRMPGVLERFSLERGLVAGVLLALAGLCLSVASLVIWGSQGFGDLVPEQTMRVAIPGAALILAGAQLAFTSFFAGIMEIDHR